MTGSPQKSSALLEAAMVLIHNPKHHRTGTWARDAAGEPVAVDAPDAVAWCADGAIRRVLGSYDYQRRFPLMQTLALISGPPLSEVNDRVGHKGTLAVMEKARAQLADAGD
jgi:hypothetical protein